MPYSRYSTVPDDLSCSLLRPIITMPVYEEYGLFDGEESFHFVDEVPYKCVCYAAVVFPICDATSKQQPTANN